MYTKIKHNKVFIIYMYLELGFPYQIKYENPTMREISQATKASGVKSSLSRGTLPSKDFHSLDPDIFLSGKTKIFLDWDAKHRSVNY